MVLALFSSNPLATFRMSAHKHILIVEDEESIAEGLRFNFEQEGHDATVVGDGRSALKHFGEDGEGADLVVLDLMLPGMSGYEISRAIREKDRRVPILVLSARTLSEDRSHAFDCGADQYMTKPFALPELLSRVKNLLERNARLGVGLAADRPPLEIFRFQDVEVDFRSFELRRGDQVHRLTTMEIQLLKFFIEQEGEVLSRSRILKVVWDQNAEVTTRTIDNFVMRLRKYIEIDPADPRHLVSVRGTGYRFVADGDGVTPLTEEEYGF